MTSREWKIDQKQRELIGQIVRGNADKSVHSELQHLIADRARLMRPERLERSKRRRLRV